MAKSWDYCDRSPCSRLIDALGKWIYGDPSNGNYVTVVRRVNGATRPELAEIRYCPFCGCRLSNLELKGDHAVTIPK